MRPVDDNSSDWTYDHHPIFEGEAVIYRTKTSGGNWQFRCRIGDEGKYVRKSLRTKDFETAKLRAKEEVLDIHGNKRAGKKIFGLKIYELVEKFIEFKQIEVDERIITSGRLNTIRAHLKHFESFKDAKTKLSELERKSAEDYANFRRVDGTKNITIRNEQCTINAMMKWAYDEGLCNLQCFAFRKLLVDPESPRAVFNPEEYTAFNNFIGGSGYKNWNTVNRKGGKAKKRDADIVRLFISVLDSTTMRVGEVRKLKWVDVVSLNYFNEEKNFVFFENKTVVNINIRPEATKTKRSRVVLARAGGYFEELQSIYKGFKPEEYVFADYENRSEMFSKRKLYDSWRFLMSHLSSEMQSKGFTYYSLRHWGISLRLLWGWNVYEVSRVAGTSVKHIETVYAHLDREILSGAVRRKVDDEVIRVFDENLYQRLERSKAAKNAGAKSNLTLKKR